MGLLHCCFFSQEHNRGTHVQSVGRKPDLKRYWPLEVCYSNKGLISVCDQLKKRESTEESISNSQFILPTQNSRLLLDSLVCASVGPRIDSSPDSNVASCGSSHLLWRSWHVLTGAFHISHGWPTRTEGYLSFLSTSAFLS